MRKAIKNTLFFFFVVNFFKLGFGDLTYDDTTCSTSDNFHTYNVYQNKILYFRSPDFPKTMVNGSASTSIVCNAKFQAKEANSQLWFITYNGVVPSFVLSESSGNQQNFYSFNSYSEYASFFPSSDIFQFQFGDDRSSTDWVAYEAAVLSLPNSNLYICPLGNQLIKLEEDRIIPITTLIGDYQYFNCTWKFSINSNLSLKLVIKKYRTSNDESLFQIETDGTIVDSFNNEIYADDPIVNTYSSQSGIFEITTDYNINMVAFVSVVKKITKYPDKRCNSSVASTDAITVTNIDLSNGYTSYDQCFYTVNIPRGYEMLLYTTDFWIENNADSVFLENGLLQLPIKPKQNYYLTSNSNETFVHFQSDGNIQDAGFNLKLESLNCECAPSQIIIPCNGTKQITALSNTTLYCTNIQCNFHIKQNPSCSSTYFSITPSILNLRYNEYIDIYINNKYYKIFTTLDNIVLSPMDNVTLKFSAATVSAPFFQSEGYSWQINVEQSKMPNFISPIFLNSSSYTNQVLWLNDLNVNDAYTVCINGNDTLDLFISDAQYLGDYYLYDSKVMESFIGTLDSSNITRDSLTSPRHISSLSGCFTIYKSSYYKDANAVVFFRMKMEDTKNCLTKNVMETSFFGTQLSMNANSIGYCIITILAGGGYDDSSPIIALSDISTSSNATYSISSAINQNKYFDFDENTNLDVLEIYTPALNVIIPPSKSLNLIALNSGSLYLTISGKTEGIFASPSYGGFKEFDDSPYKLYSISGQDGYTYMMTLDVVSLDENSTVIISNEFSYSNLTITSNSSISINGSEFNLYYDEKYPGSSGFLINYNIEPIFAPTTTTKTTTTQQVTSTSTSTTTTPRVTSTSTSTTTTPRVTSTTPSTTTSLAPSTINVTLSTNKLYYVYWLDDLSYNQTLTVCSGDDLEFFVSYGYYLSDYNLYDSNNQNNFIGSLDSKNLTTPREDVIPRSIMSNSKCFMIVKALNYNRQTSTIVLFRMKQKQSQDCGGVNNVFQTPQSSSPQITFNVSPTNGKTCEVLVLNSNAIIKISSIIAHDDAYIDIYSAVNQRKIFETNSNDAVFWKNVVIYATAISLKVFGNAVFDISYSYGTINYDDGYQKGIFVSQKYTGSSMSSASENYAIYKYSNSIPMAQTFKVRELMKDSDVQLKIDGVSYNLLKNSSIKALSSKFEFYCTKDDGFLIEYYLNPIINITLKTNSSTYALWLDNLNPYQAMTICASSSDKLELFAGSNVDLSKYQLYDSQSFNYLVGNFSKDLTSSSGCFTLYNNGNTQATFATLIFRMTRAQSSHCTTSNVFSIDSDSATFTSSSDSSGSCEMIILAPNLPWPNINIQSINFSSNDNIALFSTINQKAIVDISASEIGLWQNFHINTPALSVFIPPSTTVTLKLNSTGRIPIIINNCVKGQKGVMVSPSYNGLQQTLNSTLWFYQFQCPNVGISYNVNNYFSNAQVFVQDNNSNKTIYSYTISSGNVDIYYSESLADEYLHDKNIGFLITYTFVDSPTVYPTTPSNNPKLSLSIVCTVLTIIFCCFFNQNII